MNQNAILKYLLILLISVTAFAACNYKDAKPVSKNAAKNMQVVAGNADSIKKQVYHFLSSASYDSVLNYAKAYKQITAAANQDSLWTGFYLDLYDSLYNVKRNERITMLETIEQAESIAKRDKEVEKDFVKALCLLSYEKGDEQYNLPVQLKFLERAAQHPDCLNKLGIGYQNWVLLTLGETYVKLNDNISGIHYLQQLYKFSKLVTNEQFRNEEVVKACFALGNAFRNMHAYDSALHYCRIATSFKQVSLRNKAFAYAAMAEVYNDKGESDKAEAPALQANLLLNKDDATDPEVIERKAVVYAILTDIALAKSNWQATAGYANRSASLFNAEDKPFSRDLGKLMLKMAKAYIGGGKLDSALHYTNKALTHVIPFKPFDEYALPLKKDIGTENTVYEALDLKAEVLTLLYQQTKKSGLLQKAVQSYELSFLAESKLTHYFLNSTATMQQMEESRLRSQKAIELCYQLYQATKNNEWPEKAFQFAERNKAFVLLQSVKRNLAANSGLLSDSIYKKTVSLQLQSDHLQNKLLEEKDDSTRRIINSLKSMVDAELFSVTTILVRQNKAYETAMQQEDSVSTSIINSSLLDAETGMVEFFAADTVTYAFGLAKDKPVSFIKYGQSLSASVNSFINFFTDRLAISNNPLGFKEAAYKLYEQFNRQLLGANFKNIIIIPDGKINFLPFDALITMADKNTGFKNAPFLVNTCNIMYGYSAAILMHQQKDDYTSKTNKVVAFAPVFAKNEKGQQPLLFSQNEIEAISSAKNNSFLKERATLANFKNTFEKACIVHIASHAIVDTASNNNNRVVFIDSSLYLNELYAMHTQASLVVLSACETGIGVLDKSEGAMSLARGFYYAGAQNVITSLWSVDDRSTATIFGDFYQHLSDNDYAGSLHAAKLNYLKNATAANASPYYWAGFVHIGYQKTAPKKSYLFALIACFVAIAAFSFLLYRRKK